MRQIPLLLLLPLISGCATLSSDAGFATVAAVTEKHLEYRVQWFRDPAERQAVEAEIAQRLLTPLTVETAVQIALWNHPGLQAAFAELAVTDADRVQAGRLRNPIFTFARLAEVGGSGIAIERALLLDILGLLTIPTRTAIEELRLQETQLRVAGEVIRRAWATRRAWIEAVAAVQTVSYLEKALEAAEAAAELARRMAAVGNTSQLTAWQHHAFYAETAAQLAHARQLAHAKREALAREMGLWGSSLSFTLPQALPDLPATPRDGQDLEAQAMRERLDLQAAKAALERLALSLGLTRTNRFVNLFQVAARRDSASGSSGERGYEIELSIPLFDWGEAREARAEARYQQALQRLAEQAIAARSGVREAYAVYRTAYALAHHYEAEVLPLRQKITAEMLLRYNGMLISPFELLADMRAQVTSVLAALAAKRDFWLADADLNAALTFGAPPPATPAAAAGYASPSSPAPH